MTSPIPRLSIAMDPERTEHVLTSQALDRLSERVEILDTGTIRDFHDPAVKEELALMPCLRLISHAAGTVKYFLSQAVFDRGVTVCSAAEANAQPVAEFSLAMILLAG